MKWIDVLKKIAKGKKPPKRIKYDLIVEEYQILIYDEYAMEYRFENDYDNFYKVPYHHLYDHIEIIEK